MACRSLTSTYSDASGSSEKLRGHATKLKRRGVTNFLRLSPVMSDERGGQFSYQVWYKNARCCVVYMQRHKLLLVWLNCRYFSKTDRQRLHLRSPSQFARFDFLPIKNVLLPCLYKDYLRRRSHFCCVYSVGETSCGNLSTASSSSQISYNLKHHSFQRLHATVQTNSSLTFFI